MKSFILDFQAEKLPISITHGELIAGFGSCFADEMTHKLKAAGHLVYKDDMGTIFHPSMLAFNLLNAYNETPEYRIVKRGDLWFSWDASSTLFGYSEEELKIKLTKAWTSIKEQTAKAKYILVTFGTAWGYELADSSEMVANCHKQDANRFNKFLSTPYEMVQDWLLAMDKIKSVNPDVQFIFSVSPVRHIKDGLVENNLSKARLLEAVHQLSMEDGANYFPAYELLIDVLRDYRFYKEDLVHPNHQAVELIWEQFQGATHSEKSIALNKNVLALKKAKEHKSLFPESEAFKKHQVDTLNKINQLKVENPQLIME